MSSKEPPCPIWDGRTSAQSIDEWGQLCNSPRAGGRFLLKQCGAPLLRPLTDRQKANLSYWIYHHNLRYRLFDKSPDLGEAPPVLDQKWVESNRDRTPSASDRALTFLRELIRCDDAGKQSETESDHELQRNLRMAAGGCRRKEDLDELYRYARAKGWLGHTSRSGLYHELINLPARIHVEEQLGVLNQSRQGFVAMWFSKSMNKVYKRGIEPALEDAGYEALRIDRKDFLGKVDDEIVAEIRRSRFVVADFTASKKRDAPGGVYYEAGFAYGMGIPVFHTCHKDSFDAVHFDTNHINHLIWETPEELREKLRNRIEKTLGRGPLNPSTERGSSGDAR